MTKPAGQEAEATQFPPAAAESDDPFGLSPWLKEMPSMAIPPLMAHPMAAMAAATAIGFGMTSHLAGIMLGAMQSSAERARALLEEAVEADAEKARGAEVSATTPDADGAGDAVIAPAAPKPERKARRASPEGRKATAAKVKSPETPAGPVTTGMAAGKAKAKAGPTAVKTKALATVRKGSGPNAGSEKAGRRDDLKMISGIGPKLEQVLNGKGIFRFADIAHWSGADVEKIEAELGLDGRIARDGWVEQARALAGAKG
ncbi:predicted flap endonuclease-1-like 5' DNA nuclease [Rhizobium subbaraonis]|uniref:Predicted flap endonuclease-1-like 5' DNA nuclease n=1 Tax=Rhizobium subbaraonis TaxID=908946 RepID=A0A285UV39_9HYPH|nr:hypothetical protein [Rhizobium subbaraonis]SOC45679.1 predicted flap endonuclease-1-like 5' DNA nuclease [Rhizobium subbaraonis]